MSQSRTGVSVEQLAELIDIPLDRLKLQLEKAGIPASGVITEKQKKELLAFLKKDHGEMSEEPKKITLKRKSISEIKVQRSSGKKGTVSVVRKRRHVYVKKEAGAVESAEDTTAEVLQAKPSSLGTETLESTAKASTDTFVPEESLLADTAKAPDILTESPTESATVLSQMTETVAEAASSVTAAKPTTPTATEDKSYPGKAKGKRRDLSDEEEGAGAKGRAKSKGKVVESKEWRKSKFTRGWGIESDPIKAEKLQTKLPEFQDVRLPKDAGFESEESVTQAVAENLASVSNPKNRQDFNDLLKLLKEKVLIKEINLSALSNPDSGIVLSPYQLLSLCDAIEKNGKVTHLHLGAAKLNTDQAFEVLQRLPTIAAPNTSLVSVNTSDCILPSNEDKLRKAQQAIKNLEKQLEFQQQFPMALKGKTQLAHRVASDIVELSRQAPSRNKVTIGNKDDKEEDQFKVKEQFTAKYLEDVVLKRLNDKVQVKEQQKKVKPGGFHFFAINFLQRGRENKKQNQDITLIRDTLKSLGRFENIHKPEEKLKQTHACLKQACAKAQDPWLQNYLRGYMRNTEASSLKLESPKTTRPKK